MLYLWVQRDGGDFNQAERPLMIDARQILCARLSVKTPKLLGYLFYSFSSFAYFSFKYISKFSSRDISQGD